MPELERYEKLPRPESIEKLIEYLSSNPNVSSVEHDGHQKLTINRLLLSKLTVFLTNIYIVGEADALDIITQNHGIDAIVTMSIWNAYSSEAKQFCKSKNVGLFKFKEFLGAVHYGGNRFIDYIPPDKRETMQKRSRSF